MGVHENRSERLFRKLFGVLSHAMLIRRTLKRT